MAVTDFQYIEWPQLYYWESRVNLGVSDNYYKFKARYNIRSDSWFITLSTLDGIALVTGRKLILRVDLLKLCNIPGRPDCMLYPDTTNQTITRVNGENIMDNSVKLYHVLPENLV